MRSGDWPAACHIGRSTAASQSPLRLGLLPLPREEFRQLKFILHSELRRRAASRRALPCPSSGFLLCDYTVGGGFNVKNELDKRKYVMEAEILWHYDSVDNHGIMGDQRSAMTGAKRR